MLVSISSNRTVNAPFRPRVILVSDQGRLTGLVTVKDVLRHELSEAHHRSRSTHTPITPSHPAYAQSNGWDTEWTVDDERGHGLEIVLEEGLEWTRSKATWAYGAALERWRDIRGQDRRAATFDYELDEGIQG